MNEDYRYTGQTATTPPPLRWYDFSPEDERRARRTFSRYFLALFLYLLIANVVALAITAGMSAIMGAEAAQAYIDGHIWFSWLLSVGPMYLIAFPLFLLMVYRMPRTVRVRRTPAPGDLLIALLICQGLGTVGSLIGNWLNSLIGSLLGHEITNGVSELIDQSPVWLILTVTVILAPIVEELLFRKLLMDRLGVYGDRIAILVSAIAFGLFHGNLYQFFYAAMLGAIFAYVYSRTGNILYTILLHAVFNFFGSVAVLPVLSASEEYERLLATMETVGGDLTAMASGDVAAFLRCSAIIYSYALVTYAAAIAGIVLLIRRRRTIFVSDRCEVAIPREQRVSIMLGNVGVILFLLISLATFILNLLA